MKKGLCYLLILSVLFLTIPLSTVKASTIDGEMVMKGLGLTLILITLIQFSRQLRSSSLQEDVRVNLSSQEMDLLQRVIMAEAGREPYEGKIAVGAVIINRILSPQFPNTLREVIYAKDQFEPTVDGSLFNEPNRDSIKASYVALYGEDPSKGALYFYNRRIVKERGDMHILSWFETYTSITVIIGDHTFAR